LAKGGLRAIMTVLVLKQTFVRRMNISAKNPALIKPQNVSGKL